MELKQVFSTPDGQTFETKAEAMDHMRRPKIVAALNKLTENNDQLSGWLADNRDEVARAFETGTIKRVSKSERKQLGKALDAVEALVEAGDSSMKFIAEHKAVILESFRWPTVKRMSDEEKASAARNTLLAMAEGNEELVNWILGNKDDILEAYEAGKVKRKVSDKAMAGLEAYRAEKAKEKEAKEAGPEAYEAYLADKAKRDAAAEAEAAQ